MTEYFNSRAVNPKPDWYDAAVKAHAEYTATDVPLDDWLTAWNAAVTNERATVSMVQVDLKQRLEEITQNAYNALADNHELTIDQFIQQAETLMRANALAALGPGVTEVTVYATPGNPGISWNATYEITPGFTLTVTTKRVSYGQG